jgi:hypothetical protein
MMETELIELMSTPNEQLKMKTMEVSAEPAYQRHYTPSARWERNANHEEEMYNWRRHFIGRSALEFKHCVLTINIRRERELQRNLVAFFLLWAEEAQFLAKALDVKWLVSACDTFADFSTDDAERATALIGATLLKTVKIYETEKLYRFKRLEPAEWPEYKGTDLFDGFSSFNIGYGDVVINLKQRIKKLAGRGTPASIILDELWERVCKFDTAFSRWRTEHFHEPTRW